MRLPHHGWASDLITPIANVLSTKAEAKVSPRPLLVLPITQEGSPKILSVDRTNKNNENWREEGASQKWIHMSQQTHSQLPNVIGGSLAIV